MYVNSCRVTLGAIRGAWKQQSAGVHLSRTISRCRAELFTLVDSLLDYIVLQQFAQQARCKCGDVFTPADLQLLLSNR